MHNRLCGRLSGHGWPYGCGNKISLLSCFGGRVLDVQIVLNSYFSITLKKKDWSFYWYFLWECPWSKNSTKSVKHISNNFIQDFCSSKAAIMDMERKFSNSTLDWYRFHHGWTSVRPTPRVWKLLTASGVRSLCASLTEDRDRDTKIGVNFHIFLLQRLINITLWGRRDMKLFSTVIFFIEIGSKTHKKSVNENR